MFVLSGGC